jgi:hypothetical protein
MGTFPGGSASAMSRQIADGYTLVNQHTYKRLSLEQMKTLQFELEKKLREVRAEFVDLGDQPRLQKRNMTISRLDGALRVLRRTVQQKRRGRL